LRPLSIGHALLLQRIGSPFAAAWQPGVRGQASVGDMLMMVLVCERPWQEAARMVSIRRQVVWRLRRLQWAARWRNVRWAVELERLLRYVAAAWEGPKVWVKLSADREPGTDLLLSMLLAITKGCGRTWEEGMDTHVRQAIFEWSAQLEMQGALEVVSRQDADLIAAAKALARASGPGESSGRQESADPHKTAQGVHAPQPNPNDDQEDGRQRLHAGNVASGCDPGDGK